MAVGESTQTQIKAALIDQNMGAELFIPAGLPPDQVTEQHCAQLLAEAGVDYTTSRADQVRGAVASYRENPDEPVTVTFRGKKPVDGEDGHFEWAEDCNPERAKESGPHGTEGKIDFYNRSAFVTVKQGQVIGKLIPPTMGEAGYDVTGKAMQPKEGQPAKIECDDTIQPRPDGEYAAKIEGVMSYDGRKVSINPSLTVEGFVDFSSGNIDFSGDVVVRKGIRDKFEVRAGGNLEVNGLIEAAHVYVGGNFTAGGGMAAKEKGFAQVDGNLEARYLDNVVGKIKGDVEVHKEVINCQLEAGGRVHVVNGAIIGGAVCAMRQIEAPSVGSNAGDKTILMLGTAPRVQRVLKEAEKEVNSLQKQADDAQEHLNALQAMKAGRSTSQREALTELMFQVATYQENAKRLTEKRDRIQNWFDQHRQVELVISKMIYLGAVVVINDAVARFDKDLKGPVTITLNHRQEPVVKHASGNIEPLKKITRMRPIKPGTDEDPLSWDV